MALRVLLADDEKEFVETLAERLDLRGIEVRVALDGKAALTTLDEMAAAEALPDVMVVDLLMPGMTGDAVLQQVRQKYPGLPVIVPREKEAACLGAAIVAAVSDRQYADDAQAAAHCVAMVTRYEPHPSAFLETKYRRFALLYQAGIQAARL